MFENDAESKPGCRQDLQDWSSMTVDQLETGTVRGSGHLWGGELSEFSQGHFCCCCWRLLESQYLAGERQKNPTDGSPVHHRRHTPFTHTHTPHHAVLSRHIACFLDRGRKTHTCAGRTRQLLTNVSRREKPQGSRWLWSLRGLDAANGRRRNLLSGQIRINETASGVRRREAWKTGTPPEEVPLYLTYILF